VSAAETVCLVVFLGVPLAAGIWLARNSFAPEKQPAAPQERPDGAVVFRTMSGTEAELVRGLLDSCGIKAFLFDDNMCRIDPGAAIAIGGIRVVMPDSQALEAREILREHDKEHGKPTPFELS
jgi:hypothetical protein